MKYIRNFPKDDCARNMSEEMSRTIQGLIGAEIFPLHVLSPSPPEL